MRVLRLAVALAVSTAVLGTAVASAAPMPAGDYTTQITGGSVTYGQTVPVPPVQGSVPLTIPSPPSDLTWSLPAITFDNITVPDQSFSGVSLSGAKLSVTFTSPPQLTLHPADGTATGAGAGYLKLTGPVGYLGYTGSLACSLGSAQSPVALTLGTPAGKDWNPTTGLLEVTTGTVNVGTPSCSSDNGLIQALIGTVELLLPATGSLTLDGTILPAQQAPSGGGQQPTGTGGPQAQPTGPVCTVPKLKKKKLKAAKKLLKRAHCAVGKVKKKKSKSRLHGRVLKQSKKAGTVLPAGTKIRLTVGR